MNDQIITRQDAKAQGLKRYFTGEPCKRGHVAERLVSNCVCVECAKPRKRQWARVHREENPERAREYYAANRERLKEASKEHYANNRAQILEHKRVDREANREKLLERGRKWREANRDKKRAYSRKYYAANRERIAESYREWVQGNRGKRTATQGKRRAAKIQRTPGFGCQCLISLFYEAAREATEKTGVEHHVDHVIPLQGRAVSGLHVASNLQILSAAENVSKGNSYAAD